METETVNILLKNYLLKSDNYTKIQDEIQDWMKLITTCEDYWRIVMINLSEDDENLDNYFISLTNEEQQNYFKFGIACFLCFVQANFTGPELNQNVQEFLQRDMFNDVDFRKQLSVNNEDVNVNIMYPALLVCPKIIFNHCIVHNFINKWWSFRVVKVHQQMMDELCPALLAKGEEFYKLTQTFNPFEGHMKAKLDIELAQFYLLYKHISKVKLLITSAIEVLGIEMELNGKLGKRTKYQEKEIAQLMLEVKLVDKTGIQRPKVADSLVPKNLSLKDDVRLDQIEFSENTDYVVLPNTEQQLLLTVVQEKLVSAPRDELQSEEIQPFLNLILNQQNTYTVRVAAILLRCKLENKSRRTIERCLKECEEILDCFKKETPNSFNRLGSFFGTNLPPIWKVEIQLADILLNIGLVQNSLDIYLKVKLWEEVIICYTILKRRQKAAEVIQEQLNLKPTVKLLCLLGDATDDITCYEKAWEMSEQRSHRAQRHWGQFLFEHKNYEECIPHYKKSLNINPLQCGIWLRLGFAALQTENWQTAATAYKRYTYLEPDGFEAWNNLAQAYIKLGSKRSAHYALLEALKYNFDNWKIWENLLIVSCDILHFSDVIRSYHRILDLKEKYLNNEALNHLVSNVCNNKNDWEGQPSQKLIKKTQELLGRITSIHSNDGFSWELYANLTTITLLQRLQYLQRAYRGYTQSGWDKNPEICLQVLYVCSKLADIVLDDEINNGKDVINSVKLNVNSALIAVKKQDWNETKILVEEVSSQYRKIIEKINKQE